MAPKLPEPSSFTILSAAPTTEEFKVNTGVVVVVATPMSELGEVTLVTLPEPLPTTRHVKLVPLNDKASVAGLHGAKAAGLK